VGSWVVEIRGAFTPIGLLQVSTDLITWRSLAEVVGSLDGHATVLLGPGAEPRARFFRLWSP
jgi:hypothetical protein